MRSRATRARASPMRRLARGQRALLRPTSTSCATAWETRRGIWMTTRSSSASAPPRERTGADTDRRPARWIGCGRVWSGSRVGSTRELRVRRIRERRARSCGMAGWRHYTVQGRPRVRSRSRRRTEVDGRVMRPTQAIASREHRRVNGTERHRHAHDRRPPPDAGPEADTSALGTRSRARPTADDTDLRPSATPSQAEGSVRPMSRHTDPDKRPERAHRPSEPLTRARPRAVALPRASRRTDPVARPLDRPSSPSGHAVELAHASRYCSSICAGVFADGQGVIQPARCRRS